MLLRPDEVSSIIKEQIKSYTTQMDVAEAGSVIHVGDGIARVYGLNNAMSGELLEFPGELYGIALNLDEDSIGAVLLGADGHVSEGDPVKRTGRIAEVPVGNELLGRVVDPTGHPVDDKGPVNAKKTRVIERIAPGVIERHEVNVPLQTGIKAIDAMIPIGRGQRELIIGDRQTGKTAIAIDTIINQSIINKRVGAPKDGEKDQRVYCVYVAIGQKASTVARVARTLEDSGALEFTCIVSANASDTAPMQYIAPYSGCAIGEEWMEEGKDVLVIYDDLSKHAVAYRALSLLLRRPPGREAYPGDVFYLHSRLLERAACLTKERGGGTLTALPIIETQAGDISAYIPTNVISITDGQIFLESEAFNKGIRPAINPGLSVSRVGGAAQIKAMKTLAGPLRLELAQFRELESFSQFGSDLTKDTLDRLNHGKRIVEVLKQPQNSPVPVEEQVIAFFAITRKHFSDIPVEKIAETEEQFVEFIKNQHHEILDTIIREKQVSAELSIQIDEAIKKFLSTLPS